MNMLKLIVFDCDGVMFDSKKSNIRYYNDILKLFGHPLMNRQEEDYCHMATVDGALEHLFRNHPQKIDDVKKEITAQLRYADYSRYMKIEPDLLDFLERTKQQYKLAISTNRSDTMIPLLQEYRMEQYFLKVMTSQTARRPKPAPDGLLEILRDLQCRPEETIFIGDSILDKMQASACGVELVAFKNKALDARYHVNSFMEILSLPPLSTSAPSD